MYFWEGKEVTARNKRKLLALFDLTTNTYMASSHSLLLLSVPGTPSEPPVSSKRDALRFLQLQKAPWSHHHRGSAKATVSVECWRISLGNSGTPTGTQPPSSPAPQTPKPGHQLLNKSQQFDKQVPQKVIQTQTKFYDFYQTKSPTQVLCSDLVNWISAFLGLG